MAEFVKSFARNNFNLVQVAKRDQLDPAFVLAQDKDIIAEVTNRPHCLLTLNVLYKFVVPQGVVDHKFAAPSTCKDKPLRRVDAFGLFDLYLANKLERS